VLGPFCIYWFRNSNVEQEACSGLVLGVHKCLLLGVLLPDHDWPHSGFEKFSVWWDINAKGGEEKGVYLGVQLPSFLPALFPIAGCRGGGVGG
jgi:hypothetical protein